MVPWDEGGMYDAFHALIQYTFTESQLQTGDGMLADSQANLVQFNRLPAASAAISSSSLSSASA